MIASVVVSLGARLMCWWNGHKRGKFLHAEENGKVKVFACPRCKRETRYSGRSA